MVFRRKIDDLSDLDYIFLRLSILCDSGSIPLSKSSDIVLRFDCEENTLIEAWLKGADRSRVA